MSTFDSVAADRSRTPYSEAVRSYRAAGWPAVLPLPPRSKYPPPKGTTGYGGRWPSDADHHAWMAGSVDGTNVALRLPAGLVALDVDDGYVKGEQMKRGRATVRRAEQRWGKLPATVAATSTPTRGAKFLYRVPESVRLDETGVGGDVEILQVHHRYVCAPPSRHSDDPARHVAWWWGRPTGELIEWDDDLAVPDPGAVTALPARWVEALVADPDPASPSPRSKPRAATRHVEAAELRHWVATCTREQHPDRLAALVVAMDPAEGGGRHGALMRAAAVGVREAAAGAYPAAQLRTALIRWMAPHRGPDAAVDEVDRVLTHVLGYVTDLDVGHTRRLLAGTATLFDEITGQP